MILIVASNLDDQAKLLRAKWPIGKAILLSVDDLTSPGWEISSTNFSQSRFVAEGSTWSVKDVTGIINILPVISPYELFKIIKEDRQYVASELNAFLFYFLSKFQCQFLNKPSAFNLSGPFVKHDEWIKECIKASLPVYSMESLSNNLESEEDDLKSATFLNGIVYADNLLDFNEEIKALADNTGFNYFTIHFKQKKSKFFFYTLCTYPDFSDERIFILLQQYFIHNK